MMERHVRYGGRGVMFYLMLHQVLAEPTWQGRLGEADIRALTPLR